MAEHYTYTLKLRQNLWEDVVGQIMKWCSQNYSPGSWDTLKRTTIEWAKSRNFPSFSQAKMEDTRFEDLKLKVGFPYLYCHQGDCEHLVIITDVRLSHSSDCLDKKLYPLLIHKNRIITQKCAVCHLYIGRWFTTNDQYAPSDPCLFCDKCFRMLHYDAEGKKLGEFLAFPYVDRGAFN